MKSVWFYNYPVGAIGIAEEDGALSHVFLTKDKFFEDFEVIKTPLIEKASVQLTEYFNGKRSKFDVPLSLHGTAFQIKVWEALQTIPAGVTRSYQDIAIQVGSPKACRAVGMANKGNPLLIIVPCHRVIGKDNTLTGFAGGLAVKKYLLELEKCYA
jgi:methylated-DNA-[protein]-cysteine S-methyltransferase